jgi:hypothetical protein
VEVEEAADGVIIEMMPGAYFFAFSKKPSSSKRGRAREELTFYELTSSPCDRASAMAPSTPRLQNGIFDGVEGCGKLLEFISWHTRPFLRPQPNKHAR